MKKLLVIVVAVVLVGLGGMKIFMDKNDSEGVQSGSSQGQTIDCYTCRGSGVCWKCDGSGKRSNGRRCTVCDGTGRCHSCGGDGQIALVYADGEEYVECTGCHRTGKCGFCDGTGRSKYSGSECQYCHGTGICVACKGKGYVR